MTVVGRSAADQAKFDMVCLRELVTLDQVTVVVDDDEVAGDGPVPELLRESAARASAAAPGPVVVEFRFGQRPTRVSTRDDATVLHVLAADGNEAALVADSLVTAIGFAHDVPKWAGDATASGVWRVGWLRRGPRGTIPDNRREAKDVSDAVVAALTSTERQGRRPGLAHLQIMLDDRAVVDFDGWLRIDQAERALAGPSRTRRKVTDRAVMLALATARAGPGPTPAAELSPVV